jgi:hypothetical protein
MRNSVLPGLVKRSCGCTGSCGCKPSPMKACWKGYEAIGMKKKGGRTVPNCVPKKK